MPEFTPNYNLTLFNDSTDVGTNDVLDFRNAFSGDTGTSNMDLIDSALGDLQDQVDVLVSQKGFIKVYANELTTNVYIADGVIGIDSYDVNMSILLAIDVSNTGTTTLNINSLGTLSLMKINSSATAINIASGDLIKERFYVFTYDGTRWVWDNAFSSDQINVVSGVSGNFTRTGAGGNLEDSGSSPSTFAVAAKGVTNGDSHDHNGGDGGQISYDNLSNLSSRNSVFYSDDFLVGTGSTSIWNGDTTVNIDSESNHNGIIDGVSGNPPYTSSFSIYNTSFSTELILKTPSSISAIGNFGFFTSALNITSPSTEYVIFRFSATGVVEGRYHNASSSAVITSTTYSSLVADTWYTFKINYISATNICTFYLYNSSSSLLWSDTLNISSSHLLTIPMLHGVDNATLIYVDYISLNYSQTR